VREQSERQPAQPPPAPLPASTLRLEAALELVKEELHT
jgi:hypothetical protein